jgi:hypothetical protein
MSRGLGRIQKKCLEVLGTKDPEVKQDSLVEQGLLDTITLAWLVFGRKQINEAQYASVRRALGALARKGLVTNLGRSFHDNTGRWALPEAARAYSERSAREWALIRRAAGR